MIIPARPDALAIHRRETHVELKPHSPTLRIQGPNIVTNRFDLTAFAFLFDVDGTLLDIAPTPQSVQVPESLRRDLARLDSLTGGATALVSGRPLSDLDRLFGPIGLALVGGHGAELRCWRDSCAHEQRPPVLNASIRQRCAAFAAGRDGILVEDKGYAIALHYRLAPHEEAAVRDLAAAIHAAAPAGTIEVLHGKAVAEIKPAGVSKGNGVRALMTQAPFAGRRPVFTGDDFTDEYAFAVMPEFDGIAFSVGRDAPGASRRFETPAEVRRWIGELVETGASPRN